MAEDTVAWPENVTVSQVRLARMTHRYDAVIRFYTEGLGLALLGSFEDHDGYDGVTIGLLSPDFSPWTDASSRRAVADPPGEGRGA